MHFEIIGKIAMESLLQGSKFAIGIEDRDREDLEN
jgi:hypothetical protein